ncbi:hypothetical protein LW4_021 [Lactococcus phage LW4]|uniref:Uncharacterized protein n=4 Tax=Teubervirus LW31 TaxID=2845420 RepID=A0A1W6JHW9_9CAUD|nr:hypothetical protein H1N70_gp20 [Lactococcus phage LW31]ARM65622.1 hypothetical protein LW31_020 [Lactococcus phage LW31]ARM65707.1 hypothetical protein LW32_020 [Lactococcus phage LW32]ARM65795.1 hypothetical protein LW33_021 [Lactococcus phage LW33]ARM65881.1 hypothetical protein LW4_021 [Lactococcus phage LW4]
MMNLLVIIGLILSLIITTSVIVYQYLLSEFIKAKKEHKRFSRTVEVRRKKMEDDFIKLGQSFDSSQEAINKMNVVLKKCNWKHKEEDDDKEGTDETKD